MSSIYQFGFICFVYYLLFAKPLLSNNYFSKESLPSPGKPSNQNFRLTSPVDRTHVHRSNNPIDHVQRPCDDSPDWYSLISANISKNRNNPNISADAQSHCCAPTNNSHFDAPHGINNLHQHDTTSSSDDATSSYHQPSFDVPHNINHAAIDDTTSSIRHQPSFDAPHSINHAPTDDTTSSINNLPSFDAPNSINSAPTADTAPSINHSPTNPNSYQRFSHIACMSVNPSAGLEKHKKYNVDKPHLDKYLQMQGFLQNHRITLAFIQEIYLHQKNSSYTIKNNYWPNYMAHVSNHKTAVLWHKSINNRVNRIHLQLNQSNHWISSVHVRITNNLGIFQLFQQLHYLLQVL